MRPPLFVLLTAVVVAGCGGPAGQSDAQAACSAYADTARQQGATTVEGTDSLRATARAAAGRAAAADPTWAPLRQGIAAAYTYMDASAQAHNAGDFERAIQELQAYFAADRRVEGDCSSAGEDIGPLRP